MLGAGVSQPEGKWIKIHVRFQCLKIQLLVCKIRPYREIGQEYEAHQRVTLAPQLRV